MESRVLLSIIVPVYNVNPYLDHFFHSLLCCDLIDCEIILSLRKSSDGSERTCKKYAQNYPFIQILHQDGKGLSNARNCALDIAKGEYILFLDSDDFIESSNLDSIIESLRHGAFAEDLIVTDFRRLEYPAQKMTNIFQIGENTLLKQGMEFLPEMLRKRQCFWNVWRYIFRFEFLNAHHIRFWEDRVSEDVDFITSVFLAEPDVVFLHCPYYVYVVGRGGSLMDSLSLNRLRDTVFILSHSIERLRLSDFAYAPQIMAQFQFEYVLNLALAVEIEPQCRGEALGLYREWKSVLADSPDRLVRLLDHLISVLGIRVMGYLLHCAKILRRRWKRGILKRS